MAKIIKPEVVDLEIVNDVLKLMDKGGLSEILVEQNGVKIQLKKHVAYAPTAPTYMPAPIQAAPVQIQTHAPAPAPVVAAPVPVVNPNLVIIKSPMVGTFYRSSSPDSPAFVKIGDTVEIGQTVCIIEAMKIMNEIKSEVKGKVKEILAENAQALEFNQPLITLEKI
ncbi:MAG: acetyl-CoA carboxylase biotin carboxyl carrier protein [bacterium]